MQLAIDATTRKRLDGIRALGQSLVSAMWMWLR